MYDQEYFSWQIKCGEFGGKAELFKFQKHIKKDFNVVDFGCGGGFILKNIDCAEKIGIEINDSAREYAYQKGIKTHPNISFIQDEWADIIISNHALEHVREPFFVVSELKKKLKNGGKFICVVPHETGFSFSLNDINKHLFTWSPQNLLNLFLDAGYKIELAERIHHSWPRHFMFVQKLFGWKIFNAICFLKSVLFRTGFQTKIVGIKDEHK